MQELRPCVIRGDKALFHGWFNQKIAGGSVTMGIVESKNGEVSHVLPSSVRFVDGKIKDYYFPKDEIKIPDFMKPSISITVSPDLCVRLKQK